MPPLGLAHLAGALTAARVPARIWDLPLLRWDDARLAREAADSGCTHFGLTANAFTIRGAARAAAAIKHARPDAVVAVGGPVGIFPPRAVLDRFPAIDVMVVGEGEDAIVGLSRAEREGRGPGDVPGVSFRDGGGIRTVPPAPPLSMDDLPPPRRDLITDPRYRMHPPFGVYPPLATVETARGCPCACNFCTLSRILRRRSVGPVADEVAALLRSGVREIHFIDPTFTADEPRTLAMCEEFLRRGLKFHWTCKTRADRVNGDVLTAMARAGCYMISYGFESGDQAVLDRLDKGMTVAGIVDAIRETNRRGIRSLAYILLGSPDETEASAEESVRLVTRNPVDFTLFGELLPDPSSALTRGLIAGGAFTEADVEAFYLDGRLGPFAARTMTGIDRRVMERRLGRANRRFYFRPHYFARRLRDLRSVRDFLNLVAGAWLIVLEKLRARAGAITTDA
jgi:radical SAM superfamily enzyme YgiQ (UPF0313 family)